MSPFLAVILVLLLGSSSYAVGRLHGQLSYRIGYRFGYRQGYFDGDRGAWSRRRREAQAALATALAVPPTGAPQPAGLGAPQGTTYTSVAFAPGVPRGGYRTAVAGAARASIGTDGAQTPVVAGGVRQPAGLFGGPPPGPLASRQG